MKKEGIQIELFCEFHNVDAKLINSFIDMGFVDVLEQNEVTLIPESDVENLERCVRLTNDLGVNLAGLEVIHNMRSRMIELRRELAYLKRLENEISLSERMEDETGKFEIFMLKDDN